MEHCFVPDTQIKPDSPTDHIEALGNYLASKKPDKIIFAGDWFDMHSLSIYDMGRKAGEGARYQEDIDAGKEALERFFKPIRKEEKKQRRKHKPIWIPEMHFLIGNHENRITRHVETHPLLHGKLSYEDFGLEAYEIRVHDFLRITCLDGIYYSHYFPRNYDGKVLQTRRGAPSAMAQVKREMHSCTAGHKQGFDIAYHQTAHSIKIGCIAGSFYLHDEDYLSPQGTRYWRGVVYKHQVEDGEYDVMTVSADYLLREWY